MILGVVIAICVVIVIVVIEVINTSMLQPS